jgi:hypothetical protein
VEQAHFTRHFDNVQTGAIRISAKQAGAKLKDDRDVIRAGAAL